jgi:hypothetical protein
MNNLPQPTPPSRRSGTLTRREMIEIGYSSMLGATLASLAGRTSKAGEPSASGRRVQERPAKSVLFIFLFGGPSHLDTFDLKPEAPAEVRGEFQPIRTSVPGLQICEHLPQLAARMNQWALVRSMTCNPSFGDHRTAVHGLLGGIDQLPPGAGLAASRRDWPSYCAGAEFVGLARNGLPAGVTLPREVIDPATGIYPGQDAGLLGSAYDPLRIRCEPADPKYRGDASLRLPDGLTIERLSAKQNLLAELNRQQDALGATLESTPYGRSKRDAFNVLTSGRLGKALALEEESEKTRDAYGRHVFGQTLLLARRLIEAGVPIVQANVTNHAFWDTHTNNFVALKGLLPHLDRAVSALTDDMRASGLLDETLVVMMGEFGRTPKLVPPGSMPHFTTPGRDHWMSCFSGLFAGGGVRGGQVIGKSDAQAAYPITKPFRHSDVGATVYSALGIDRATTIRDLQDRPLRLNEGEVMAELYA